MNNIDDRTIILLFRIQFEDKTFRTIGNLQIINKNDFNILSILLNELLDILNDEYKNLPIINIVFSYKILDNNNRSKIDSNNIKSNKLPMFKIYGYNLPSTTDINKWGKIIKHNNNHYIIKRFNSELLYDITVEPLWNIIKIKNSHDMII
jgi:hypothetical protein